MIVFEQTSGDFDSENGTGFVRVGTLANNIPELLEIFERFLLGCGFVLSEGCHIGRDIPEET
jgi:hypothetical protein